jgi:hypothetical protein
MFKNIYLLTKHKGKWPLDAIRIHTPPADKVSDGIFFYVPWRLAHDWGFEPGVRVEVLIDDERETILVKHLKRNGVPGPKVKKNTNSSFVYFRVPEVDGFIGRGQDILLGPERHAFKAGLYLYLDPDRARMDKAIDKLPTI